MVAKALTLKGIKVSLVFATSENKSLKVNYTNHYSHHILTRMSIVGGAKGEETMEPGEDFGDDVGRCLVEGVDAEED